MPQEALVRDIVTDTLTDGTSDALVDKEGREDLKKSVLRQIKKRTDVHAEDVLFTDISVQ